MPAARKTWRPIVLVSVGAVAFAAWPRGPRLEFYTTPLLMTSPMTADPLDVRPHQLSLLIPEGWQLAETSDITDGMEGAVGGKLLRIRPGSHLQWLPFWVRRLFERDRSGDCLNILVGAPVMGSTAKERGQRLVPGGVYRTRHGETIVTSEGRFIHSFVYGRSDQAAFEATYRPICESFRVVRQ